jgi:hypothetical protein
MGCFFAQNLTVFEKPKPKDQSERDAVKPSVFAARFRAGVYKGTVVYVYGYEGAPCVQYNW